MNPVCHGFIVIQCSIIFSFIPYMHFFWGQPLTYKKPQNEIRFFESPFKLIFSDFIQMFEKLKRTISPCSKSMGQHDVEKCLNIPELVVMSTSGRAREKKMQSE